MMQAPGSRARAADVLAVCKGLVEPSNDMEELLFKERHQVSDSAVKKVMKDIQHLIHIMSDITIVVSSISHVNFEPFAAPGECYSVHDVARAPQGVVDVAQTLCEEATASIPQERLSMHFEFVRCKLVRGMYVEGCMVFREFVEKSTNLRRIL